MHGRKWVWLWVWAFLICYAQVYVGKHFPGDVFVGGVLGTIVGLLFALIFRRWLLRGAVATAQALPRIGE
jgi:undecaprenyl-diphosphatase